MGHFKIPWGKSDYTMNIANHWVCNKKVHDVKNDSDHYRTFETRMGHKWRIYLRVQYIKEHVTMKESNTGVCGLTRANQYTTDMKEQVSILSLSLIF